MSPGGSVHGRQKGLIKVRTAKAAPLSVGEGHLSPATSLTWLVEHNPKRKGTSSYKRFQKYRRAKTLGEFEQAGGDSRDLRADLDRGFLKVHNQLLMKKPASSINSETSHDPSTGTPTQQEDIKVACLGDSNTTGSGLGDMSYPNRLQFCLNTDKYRTNKRRLHCTFSVRGFGVSGAHAAHGSMHYGTTEKFSSASASKSDIYVIMLGTNDAHQARGNPGKVQECLEALVGKLRTARPSCAPVLVLPPGANSQRCRDNMKNIVHPGIRRLGKKLGLTVVDATLRKHMHLRSDKIHLNSAGAQKLARKIREAIIKIVKVTKK